MSPATIRTIRRRLRAERQQPDIFIERHGSIFVFQPMTAKARAWVRQNIQLESWQWTAGGFVVDHRYAEDLAAGMSADGLRLI